MKEKQAIEKGYRFSGVYSHDKEEVKNRIAEEKVKGNKAVLVNKPPSRYSRGHHGMGYSMYVIESEENKKKIVTISTSKMVADAIERIHYGTGSISELLS